MRNTYDGNFNNSSSKSPNKQYLKKQQSQDVQNRNSSYLNSRRQLDKSQYNSSQLYSSGVDLHDDDFFNDEQQMKIQLLDGEQTNSFFKKIHDEDMELDVMSQDELFYQKHQYEDEEDIENTKTTFQTVLRISNSGMQCVVVFLPYFASQFGLIVSIGILVSVYFMSIFSSVLLLKCKNISRRSNYTSIVSVIFGHKGEFIVRIFIAFMKLGYIIIIVGVVAQGIQSFACLFQNSDPILGCRGPKNSFYLSYKFYVLCIALLMCFFIFSKNVYKLQAVAYMRWIAMGCIAIVIQVLFVISLYDDDRSDSIRIDFLPQSDYSFQRSFSSIPVIIMIFSFHLNIFSMYKRMRNICDKKMVISSVYGNTWIAIMYGFIGLMGYISFGNKIKYNILSQINNKNYELGYRIGGGILLSIFSIAMISQIPHFFFEVKYYLYSVYKLFLLLKLKKKDKDIQNESECKNKNKYKIKILQLQDSPIFMIAPKFVNIILSIILLIITILTAYFSSDYIFVCTFVGGMLGNMISFIIPSLLYLKVSHNYIIIRLGAWILLIISLFLFFSTTLAVVLSINNTLIQ